MHKGLVPLLPLVPGSVPCVSLKTRVLVMAMVTFVHTKQCLFTLSRSYMARGASIVMAGRQQL